MSQTGSRLWLLGAPDHEMAAIDALLRQCGERVEYAQADGARCHAGNAYRAGVNQPMACGTLYTVECELAPEARDGLGAGWCVAMDHHRPRDAGSGRGPAEFLPASSLGQVIAELARLDRLPKCVAIHDVLGPDKWGWIGTAPDRDEWQPGHIYHETFCVPGEWWVRVPGARAYRVPRYLVLTAAADHCLGSAYLGDCPGVQPEELRAFREQEKARARGVDVATVHADIERAIDALQSAPIEFLGYRSDEERDADPDATGGVEVADMRAQHIPELPEAACIAGIPFIAMGIPGPDGRQKVVLQAAGPEELRLWPAWAAAHHLVDVYGGDPARGFAGAYAPVPVRIRDSFGD